MGQWTGVKPTPEQHRTAELARIADALERIANRPRFITLSHGQFFNIDHIRRVSIDGYGGGWLYLDENESFYPLSAVDVTRILAILELTGSDR